MSVIFLLFTASIIVAGGFLAAFLWAARNGQFEDDQTPAMRMLFDDTPSKQKTAPDSNETNSTPNQP